MKKFTLLFTLLFIAIFSSKEAMAVELDTVWVSDINGQVLFQHPISKNILIANNGITELFSQDGKFVRNFPLNTENTLEMSPDGTKMLYYFWEDTKFIIELYDYNTQKVIFKTAGLMPKFLDNNNFVFLLPSDGKQVNLNICKIDNLEITKHPISSNGSVTAFSTSPNGKYIAYATFDKITDTESKAHLYLLDAETMQGLGELGSWDSDWKKIESISFSPNSKLCRILSYSSSIPITIFDIEKSKVLQKYNQDEVSNHLFSIDFIDNEYILLRGGLNKKDATTQIQKFLTKEILYEGPIFLNQFTYDFLNYNLFCNYDYNREYFIDKIYCFNINKIITGISQTNPIIVKYSNKKLIINSNNKPINYISIMTIEGREVLIQSFEELVSMNNQIEIPLELSNGLYLINITSGQDNFVHKLLIKE